MHSTFRPLLCAAGTIFLLAFGATSLLAGDAVIQRGLDLWQTPPNGATFSDFSSDPIPAGFFCPGSKAFRDRIEFEGVPVATDPPGVFGDADTLVERLDDAGFNKQGKGVTRVRVRAMSFASLAPIVTECGIFDVRVSLDGEQPITIMHIFREGEEGGRFSAPISVHIKMTFTPVAMSHPLIDPEMRRRSEGRAVSGLRPRLPARFQDLQLTRSLNFAADPEARWHSHPGIDGHRYERFLLVDTDGDFEPDTEVPGTSNFAAGWWNDQGQITNRRPSFARSIGCGCSICHCVQYDPETGCSHNHCTDPK